MSDEVKPRFVRPKKPKETPEGEKKKSVKRRSPKDNHPSTVAQMQMLRRMACTDFVQDSLNRSVEYHYHREDRPYRQLVEWKKFRRWYELDRWVTQRRNFWEDISAAERKYGKDKILRDRREMIEFSREILVAFREYLVPIRNENGTIARDENTGLPKFALEMPTLDKGMAIFLKFAEHLEKLQSLTVDQIDIASNTENEGRKEENKPLPIQPRLSREEFRELAKSHLMQREPSLKQLASGSDAVKKSNEGQDA